MALLQEQPASPDSIMNSDQDLLGIRDEIATLRAHFQPSNMAGFVLPTEHSATYRGLATEAKSIIDAELGPLNDFSRDISNALIEAEHRFIPGPSLADVENIVRIIEAAVRVIRRRPAQGTKQPGTSVQPYVDPSRLAVLRGVRSTKWDLTRLIRMCEELNSANEQGNLISIAMLVRSIVDHVPPIFGRATFTEVANNVAGRSMKGSLQHLDQSLRNIADGHLHVQIRSSEVLPAPTQVHFRTDLDVLLGEIVRLLKT